MTKYAHTEWDHSQFTQLIERSLWLQKVKKEDATENDISNKKNPKPQNNCQAIGEGRDY